MTLLEASELIYDFHQWHTRESIRNWGKIGLTKDATLENGYWVWKGYRLADLQQFMKKELSKQQLAK
jgi:hypothetical protein